MYHLQKCSSWLLGYVVSIFLIFFRSLLPLDRSTGSTACAEVCFEKLLCLFGRRLLIDLNMCYSVLAMRYCCGFVTGYLPCLH